MYISSQYYVIFQFIWLFMFRLIKFWRNYNTPEESKWSDADYSYRIIYYIVRILLTINYYIAERSSKRSVAPRRQTCPAIWTTALCRVVASTCTLHRISMYFLLIWMRSVNIIFIIIFLADKRPSPSRLPVFLEQCTTPTWNFNIKKLS